MNRHGFKSISEFKGASLPYFTTHTDLVAKQKMAVAAKKAKVGLHGHGLLTVSCNTLTAPMLARGGRVVQAPYAFCCIPAFGANTTEGFLALWGVGS